MHHHFLAVDKFIGLRSSEQARPKLTNEGTIMSDSVSNEDVLSAWERRLEKHGWPTLLVLIGFLLLWRFMVWFQPKLDSTIEAHWQFLKATQETQLQQAENGKQMAAQTSRLAEISDRQERRSEEIAKQVGEVHRAVLRQPVP